jgi:dolichyl-phosphate beta-glucosyltransferase
MSVIVPVFNEEAEIPTIVPAISQALEARGGDWELIVVDNASTDATVTRMQRFLEDSRIRLLSNEVNRGKGYSVRRGMLEARGDLRLMCDADCSASLASLPAMEAATADADVVAGVRNAPDSQVVRHQPLYRRTVSLGFILLCRAVMSEPLRDVFCGFKLFTAPAAHDVFTRSRIEGWVFDAEAMALARALGYRVRACGIAWVNRPASRLSIPRVVLPALRELVATRAYVRGQVRHAQGTGPATPSEPTTDPEKLGSFSNRVSGR